MCDHNEQERAYYTLLCRALGKKYQIDLELKEYNNCESLLFDMQDPGFSGLLDMLFLETDMPSLSGIYVANELRRLGYNGLIIFLTNSTEYYEDAFDAKAFNYIRKGKEHLGRFETIFINAADTAQKVRREYIIFNCAGEYRQIEIGYIQYFEIRDHIINVYYQNENFEFISSLAKIEAQLFGRGFQRIHRSILISLDYIQKISYDEVTLVSGKTLPVGRTYYSELKTAMDKWRQ